jgi:DNA-binding XRE family transcriptional regulator
MGDDPLWLRKSGAIPSAGELIRNARHPTGLSQAGLGRRAGLTQCVIGAYEAGARPPSLPMLTRLVEAAGLRLAPDVQRPASGVRRQSGPMGDGPQAPHGDCADRRAARRRQRAGVRQRGPAWRARTATSTGSWIWLLNRAASVGSAVERTAHPARRQR